jgi:NAD+ synthetase
VTTYLAVRALGHDNVTVVRMPYRTSSPESLAHAQLVVDALGVEARTLEITDAVDGYLRHEPDADAQRRGNVMARTRMIALFDLSARYRALPLGTGNKTERLFGYFTWHADDSPPINPLGDSTRRRCGRSPGTSACPRRSSTRRRRRTSCRGRPTRATSASRTPRPT